MSTHSDYDRFNDYEAQFDPMYSDRQARRKRKPKTKHTPKKAEQHVLHEIAETTGLEGGFETTYTPSRFESGWLLAALRPFYEQHYIVDVLALVKGGKEASVYTCQGSAETADTLLAAKVYRPRMFRQLRNDAMYREGRSILKTDGTPVLDREHRAQRAMAKRTRYGQELEHTSWLIYEYRMLHALWQAGAAVPRPYGMAENAILMEYIGDEGMAAPLLSEVHLDEAEVQPLFEEALRNIRVLLAQGVAHGDLSAYNMLYWEGGLKLIDFPQVTDVHGNPQAYRIFGRDVQRVCAYFNGYGLNVDAELLIPQLWTEAGLTLPSARQLELDAWEDES